VFLGYNYSHLGYYYLDLTSQHIFIFQMFPRHIRFHEQVFLLTNLNRWYSPTTPLLVILLLPTCLILLILYFFYCLTPVASPPHILPTISSIFKQPTSFALMSLYACLSNNHSLDIGFPLPELQFFRSDIAGSLGSTIVSSRFVIASPASRSESPAGLNLVFDLSSYPLQ